MKYLINSTGNTIIADLAFVEAHYPGDYTEVIEAPVVAPAIPWSKKEFLLKFTPAEYAAISAAAKVDSTIDYYWTLFMVAENVLRTDPATIGGINALESAGLLATGRAAEILA